MDSETFLWLAIQAAEVAPALDGWIDLAKLLVPAAGAYLVARLQARKDQRVAQNSLEENTRQALVAQQERLTGSWESLTSQARETVARAYADAAEAAVARRAAEQKVLTMEAEMASLRIKYESAIAELEELRRKARRRPREERE